MRLVKIIIAFLCTSLLFSCASQQVEKKRFFWPPLPAEPKIEWIGNFANKADLLSGGPSLFQTIVGDDADSASLNRPVSITADSKGRVFVADSEKKEVLIFDFNTKDISVLGGENLAGLLDHLAGLAVDANDNIYVADARSRKIHVVSPANTVIKVLDLSEQMTHVGKIAIDKTREKLILTDLKDHKIFIYDLNGRYITSFGKRGDGDGEFNLPTGVAVEKDGTIVVSDSFNARVQRFDQQGKFINKFGRRGDGPGDFALIKGVAVDSEDHIYITDGKLNNFSVFNNKGVYLLSIGATYASITGSKMSMGGFLVPQGIYIDQNDRIYIADQMNNRFQVFQYINEKYKKDFPIVENKKAK